MCAAVHGWFYDWQTLIAGLLALLAGVVTVVGTVWGILSAANRQVKAVNAAADRQITAAREQTAAAQHQTEVMRDMERRRIASEGYAFHAMLEAAMDAVIDDVAAARKLPQEEPSSRAHSSQAYVVRQRVKRAGFAELRGAFLGFGGTLTAQFLQLDKEIEDFSAQWMPTYNQATGFPTQPLGVNAGIWEQLNRIEQQAQLLRYEAENRMEINRAAAGTDVA
jgi:hypothetical protein